MKVNIYTETDRKNSIAQLQLDTIPREGEKLWLHDILSDEGDEYTVLFVRHDFPMSRQQLVDHRITLIVCRGAPDPRFVFALAWNDSHERPEWLPDEFAIFCDYLPRAGELLSIVFVDPENPEAMEAAQTITAEITAIAHGSYYQRESDDYDNGLGYGDLASEIYVRRVDAGDRDVTRTIARPRRN